MQTAYKLDYAQRLVKGGGAIGLAVNGIKKISQRDSGQVPLRQGLLKGGARGAIAPGPQPNRGRNRIHRKLVEGACAPYWSKTGAANRKICSCFQRNVS